MSNQRSAWLPWVSVAVLAALCGGLAILQYRWIGEISGAERQNLEAALHDRIENLRRDCNQEFATAARALQPSGSDVDQLGREAAYTAQYRRWKTKFPPFFRRIALAVPDADRLNLLDLNLQTGQFSAALWPAEWNATYSRLMQQLQRHRVEPFRAESDPVLLEMPRFGANSEPPSEQDWLILEPDFGYARDHLLPDLLARHLGTDGKPDYDAELVLARDPTVVIYRSSGNPIGQGADASVTLLDGRIFVPPQRFPGGPPRKIERFTAGRGRGFGRPGPPPGVPGPEPGLWLLRVRHHAGSLEALVAQARRRNLAVSAGILLLILATVSLLVHSSRRAQQLAEMQINFVAGVSHELRTPLTVIRTAAYNLRGKLAQKAEQVEQYGALIQDESEKLGDLIEQILQFASAKAGHIIRRREPVSVDSLVEDSLESGKAAFDGVVFETRVEPGLPPVFADEAALKHALRNLVDNAVKYSYAIRPWVGIFVSAVPGDNGPAVEISVVDHGPGIPADEQKQIFDPFFRGRRALADQVHGTGLGLDLVKRIVEAHAGTIRVESEPGKGSAFIVRLPAMTIERQDELAHSLG
ncbi:MAG TPA: HAMP domain-containing sensor histidine kinase [Bryobacteraceae bacterium]